MRKAILIAVGSAILISVLACSLFVLRDKPHESGPDAIERNAASGPVVALPAPPPSAARAVVDVTAPRTVPASYSVSEQLTLARRIASSDPKRARQILRQVLEVDPRNEEALESLAAKMLSDENTREAKEFANRCTSANRSNEVCNNIHMLIPPPSSVFSSQSAENQLCLKAFPDRLSCLYGRVNILIIENRFSDAEPLMHRLWALSDESPFSILAKARLKAHAGAYADARRLFQKACDIGDADTRWDACFRNDVLRREGW